MAVHLTPMSKDEFKEYLEHLIPDYARDNVEAGYWDEKEALERSRKSVTDLLPNGVNTPNHHIF
ncbi:MAG: hypothetical protein WEC37_00380, partial [Anaerolineales bacterium]